MAGKFRATFEGVGALLGWSALLLQYWIAVQLARTDDGSLVLTTVSFFSYFTIVTNLLVALALTSQRFGPASRVRAFLARPATTAAITVYIAVVVLVYSVALRSLWQPTGLQRVADVMLHDIMPIVWIVHWVVFAQRGPLPWRLVPLWLALPVTWFSCILLRGWSIGSYPYPFLDVASLGYTRTLLNALIVLGVFIVVSAIVVMLGRVLARPGTRLRLRGPEGVLQRALAAEWLHGKANRPRGNP